MAVIALINQKGGCGKSTTAGHLCRWLSKRGGSVALVDCDAQGTSSAWIGAIAPCPAAAVEQFTSADDVIERLPDIAEGHSYVVIDGPGGVGEISRAMLLRSDIALIPVKPTGADIRSAADAVRLVKQAQSVRGGLPRGALFLSMAVKGSNLKAESLAVLEGLGLPVLAATVHQKQAIADTFGQQSTVFDMGGRAAADSAREFDQLFTEAIAL
jgi:chromosome partitioning protein